MVAGLIVLLLFVFLAFGMPVAFSLGVAGALGIYLVGGFDILLNMITTVPYRSVASYTLATIPLFILMAEFVNQGGLAKDLFSAAQKFVGRLPGGVAIATVFASAGFGAMSGSSTAAGGTMASITLPEFKRLGYGIPAATGIVAVAGTLAVMIPPSIPLVMYGIMTESSIGKLLIAGIIPGVLTALIYMIGIMVWSFIDPQTMPKGEAYPWKEKLSSLKNLWGFIIIVAVVVFALYGGVVTSSEIAAFGAAVTLIFLLITQRITLKGIGTALIRTVFTSTMIMSIIIGAMIFGYFLTMTQVPQQIISFIGESGLPPWSVLILVLFIYLILGFFMDQIAILIITLPLTFPLITSLGYDAIWFGILVVKMVEIGLVTPPVGMNVYVVSGATGVPVTKVFQGTGYMLLFELVSLILLLLIPELVTWLPYLTR